MATTRLYRIDCGSTRVDVEVCKTGYLYVTTHEYDREEDGREVFAETGSAVLEPRYARELSAALGLAADEALPAWEVHQAENEKTRKSKGGA